MLTTISQAVMPVDLYLLHIYLMRKGQEKKKKAQPSSVFTAPLKFLWSFITTPNHFFVTPNFCARGQH